MADSVDAASVRAVLVTSGSRWSDVEHHASIGSTNARAAELAAPWHVVVADHQSAGRGRLRRTWEAPPGTSIAVSATVPVPQAGAGWLPLLTGLAVLEAIEAATPLTGVLKWPNDVLLEADGRRKVCGILGEVAPSGVVVLGAGINLTQSRDQLPVATATSLRLSGAEVERSELVATYLTRLETWYAVLAAGGSAAGGARTAYRRRCSTIGEEVALSQASGPDVVGRAVEVDDEGRLVIESAGERRAWAAGDVVHVRAPAPGGATT
jgi:BirA family biotin operon repressor/biotin-[acetyl-CoA-carboxylase] ligase